MEALSNYEKIVNQNALLKKELELERIDHADDIEQLSKKIDDLEDLKVKYEEFEYGLKEFDALVQSKVKEWQEKEMVSQVEERLTKEAPRLLVQMLKAELQAYPEGCLPQLKELIDSAATTRMNKYLMDKESWPEWFMNQYRLEVQQGIHQGIDKAFNTRVKLMADERLQQLIHGEWSRFVEEKITPFCRNSLKSQLKNMVQMFYVTCGKCGSTREVTLTPDNIAKLIKRHSITVDCWNPMCKGLLWPHRIHVTLGMVISVLVSS